MKWKDYQGFTAHNKPKDDSWKSAPVVESEADKLWPASGLNCICSEKGVYSRSQWFGDKKRRNAYKFECQKKCEKDPKCKSFGHWGADSYPWASVRLNKLVGTCQLYDRKCEQPCKEPSAPADKWDTKEQTAHNKPDALIAAQASLQVKEDRISCVYQEYNDKFTSTCGGDYRGLNRGLKNGVLTPWCYCHGAAGWCWCDNKVAKCMLDSKCVNSQPPRSPSFSSTHHSLAPR